MTTASDRYGRGPNLELPYYATYSKQPTGGRVILPHDHQIAFTSNLPWEIQKDLGDQNSDTRITAVNKAKPRSVDVDLEEDDGAYATYIPVTYQLPHSDDVIRNQINSFEMNEISDKLDSVKDDITKSIGRLLRNSGSCRLCNIFNTEDSPSARKNTCSDHFHGRDANYYKPHVTYNPQMDFEANMKKLMKPRCVTRITEDANDDWQLNSPIRRVQDEINRKAAAMNVDRIYIRKIPDTLSKKMNIPIYEDDDDLKIPPPPRYPKYRSSRYPTDHLLTRRRGYKYIS